MVHYVVFNVAENSALIHCLRLRWKLVCDKGKIIVNGLGGYTELPANCVEIQDKYPFPRIQKMLQQRIEQEQAVELLNIAINRKNKVEVRITAAQSLRRLSRPEIEDHVRQVFLATRPAIDTRYGLANILPVPFRKIVSTVAAHRIHAPV